MLFRLHYVTYSKVTRVNCLSFLLLKSNVKVTDKLAAVAEGKANSGDFA